jgi:hypothetical protein
MTKAEIENQVVQELHDLPVEKVREVLDFVLFLHSRLQKTDEIQTPRRPLGLLKGKAECRIGEDFSVTDEEFLAS